MAKPFEDRRAKRTKRMIKAALTEIIEEKGCNNISISDITTRADINRGTFYLHYTDKYDLLEQFEAETIKELDERINVSDYISILNDDYLNKPLPFMVNMFEYLKENSAFMKAILGPKGDPQFHSKMKEYITSYLFGKKFIKLINQENMLVPESYFISYILSAHLGVIQQWLVNNTKESPEEMALILTKLFYIGPSKVSGIYKSK